MATAGGGAAGWRLGSVADGAGVAEGARVGLGAGDGSTFSAVGVAGITVGLAGACNSAGRVAAAVGVVVDNAGKTRVGAAIAVARAGRGVLVGVGIGLPHLWAQPPRPNTNSDALAPRYRRIRRIDFCMITCYFT